MKYICTLLAVSDMDISKNWYSNVLGLDVVADYGANVTLSDGIALQTLDKWKEFINNSKVQLPSNACEIYFEEDDIDAFVEHLKAFEISYVHELFEHRWGQRVVRLYDPDKHIIEVGERMQSVVKRFVSQGLSAEETAIRMDIPLDFVVSCLKE